MQLSVTEPVSQAIERSRAMLFSPFDLHRWLVGGFVAFLAYLGESGGYSFNFPTGSGGGSGGGGASDLHKALRYFHAHEALIIAIGVGVLVVGVTIGVLVLWVSSRGKLMFVDMVSSGRIAVKEPWHRLAELGGSLFRFRLLLALASFVAVCLVLGSGAVVAWPDITAFRFGRSALIGIGVASGVALFTVLPLAIVRFLLEDFVVPAMWRHQLRVGEAWRRVQREILSGNIGSIVVFWLMTIALAIGIGVITMFATCLTCCLAALPYLGRVVLLPVSVFRRCYSLYFIEQFGPEWRFFPPPAPQFAPPPPPPPAPQFEPPPPPPAAWP